MKKPLADKVQRAIQSLRELWLKLDGKLRFVGFSTGKDSLALAAMLYEAVEPERPTCLYVHHDLEFPGNLEYLEQLKSRGFAAQVLRPFLEYFDLMDRGMGFLTLKNPWCVPMLIGTALLEWLQRQGARSPRDGVLFRGMSGSEYSHKFHTGLELYDRLDLPVFNPLLGFSKEDILDVVRRRYDLPLNPIYQHMDRSYCIVCYTSDARRQAYSGKHFPEVCARYYRQIESMLFDSGLIEKGCLDAKHRSREEKLHRHGFVHWRRIKAQEVVGAVKRRLSPEAFAYRIRDPAWIATKHLAPVGGRWVRKGDEIRFWNVEEQVADTVIKKMLNCLDCGFCVVECFSARRFDRATKSLQIDGCIQCGRCLRLKFCMGWQHRFWRRVIVREDEYAA
jgi:3'-phosphoadenosine 5'-phosphosulfate sulfotransferase (PAPS reductase)/FAD synthetase